MFFFDILGKPESFNTKIGWKTTFDLLSTFPQKWQHRLRSLQIIL